MQPEILPQSVAIIVLNQDGWFSEMNSAAQRLLGENVLDFINKLLSTSGHTVIDINNRRIRVDTLKTDQATYLMLFEDSAHAPGEQSIDTYKRAAEAPPPDLTTVRAKSTALIAHQFATPISAVRLKNYLLKKHLDSLSSERIAEHLEQIEGQLDLMVDLLDDLLLVNQVYTAQQIAAFSPLDLEAFCKKIIDQLTLDLDGHDVILTYSGRIHSVQLDRRLIRYVLSNLVGCILKYLGSTVHLDVRRVENTVTFSVNTPNLALSPARMNELFNQASCDDSGMGLGLSIMKMCVEMYNGTITIENRSGVGASFVVSLPCQDAR